MKQIINRTQKNNNNKKKQINKQKKYTHTHTHTYTEKKHSGSNILLRFTAMMTIVFAL